MLCGASAGGMTAALASAVLHTNFEHITTKDVIENSEKLQKNPLYHSWVDLTESDQKSMMEQMLSSSDIIGNSKNEAGEVWSLFNANFIREIAERHINNIKRDPNVNRPYFAKDAEVLATLTNLRGIPFKVNFNNPSYTKSHRMTRYSDIAHFKITPNEKYNNDGRIPVHFENAKGYNKDLLVQSAIATGGFPIGLAPVVIKRLGKYIKDNKFINLGNQRELQTINNEDLFETLNVDGGTINNEPFFLTQEVLDDRMGVTESTRKISAKEFNSAVLMIDPFPNFSELPKLNYTPLKALKFIIPSILSAMMGELRMKEDILRSAYGTEDYTKYLIIPARSEANEEIENHIACGSFQGFGGFFSKKFRQHDFLLGRRNCQRFLRWYFSVPASEKNTILAEGYKGKMDPFLVSLNEIEYLPIIPDIRVRSNEDGSYKIDYPNDFNEEKYNYPGIEEEEILKLKPLMKKRVSVILKHIMNGKDPEKVNADKKKSWTGKLISLIFIQPLLALVMCILRIIIKNKASNKFIEMVLDDMRKNELIITK